MRQAAQAEQPEPEKPAVGDFCWHELMANDVEGAKKFYGEICGWTFEKTPMPMEYWLLKRGDKMAGGLMANPVASKGVPPHWLAYVAVGNVDESHRRALALGAKEINPAMDIPNIGRFTIIADPTGAVISLFQGK